uniref:Uncharacterized protein ORF112 n=1 Tax=Phaeoceros laevis TaxID=37308 RepID=D3J0J9_9EMBR|nr:hypothetical protein PhlaMp30 [Phaeoceros laevis]ACT75313.1 hypothetical protein PhlaMp30 [Phaeoceros laevis]
MYRWYIYCARRVSYRILTRDLQLRKLLLCRTKLKMQYITNHFAKRGVNSREQRSKLLCSLPPHLVCKANNKSVTKTNGERSKNQTEKDKKIFFFSFICRLFGRRFHLICHAC